MSNLVLYEKGSSTISFFIEDCIKDENNFEGSNISLKGVSLSRFDFIWTNDSINLIDKNKFDKNISEIITVSSSENTHILRPNRDEFKKSIKILERITQFNSSQIENRINNNIVNLETAKEELISLSKVIKAMCNYIYYKI